MKKWLIGFGVGLVIICESCVYNATINVKQKDTNGDGAKDTEITEIVKPDGEILYSTTNPIDNPMESVFCTPTYDELHNKTKEYCRGKIDGVYMEKTYTYSYKGRLIIGKCVIETYDRTLSNVDISDFIIER